MKRAGRTVSRAEPAHAIKPAPMTTPGPTRPLYRDRIQPFMSHRRKAPVCCLPKTLLRKGAVLPDLTIRPARPDEYDEVARVWMDSFVSTGLDDGSTYLLAELRARIPGEIDNGWSLYVADDHGRIAAMLALHLPRRSLDQLFVAPDDQRNGLGRRLLAFTREKLPDEIWLRCIRENEIAWRWYEREGFRFEKEALEPATGFTMKYYRWKRATS